MASMDEAEDLENLDGVEEVGLDQGASPEEASPVEEEKTTIGIAGYSVSLPTKVVPYVAMELMAVILLIALTTNAFARNSGNYGYGLTVVILAMLLGMAGIYLVTKPALYDKSLATLPVVGPVSLGYGLAVFLSIWWFVGACVLTFSGPFTVTSKYVPCVIRGRTNPLWMLEQARALLVRILLPCVCVRVLSFFWF